MRPGWKIFSVRLGESGRGWVRMDEVRRGWFFGKGGYESLSLIPSMIVKCRSF